MMDDMMASRRAVLKALGLGGIAAAVAACRQAAPTTPAAGASQQTPAGVTTTSATTSGITPTPPTAGKRWAEGIRIRFFVGGDPGDAFATIVLRGAQQAEADLGPKVDYVFSNWIPDKMISQLREAIAARPDGIAMMGHPGNDAIMPLAKEAHEAGILMMYQNVDVPKVREQYGGGYVGVDLAAQGRTLGQAALSMFGLKAGDKAMVFGAWDVPGRFIREDMVAKTFEEAGLKVQRVSVPQGTNPEGLLPILSSAFLSQPDTKIICYTGGRFVAAAPRYMQAVGKKPGEVLNIGFDLNPAVMKAIQDGWVQLTADQQPFLQGYLPILSLCLMKRWRFTPLSYNTGASLITKDNYKDYLDLVNQGVR